MTQAQYDPRMPGERPEGGTYVVRRKPNKINIPETLEGALQNHRYVKAVDEQGNPCMAYEPINYGHQEFPKMLYHPNFGQKPQPKVQAFAAGATTPEQFEAALERFNVAMSGWNRANRTKLVEDAREEKALITKGWVAKMPTRPIPVDSADSDEI
jgi:hypothetical protein